MAVDTESAEGSHTEHLARLTVSGRIRDTHPPPGTAEQGLFGDRHLHRGANGIELDHPGAGHLGHQRWCAWDEYRRNQHNPRR